MTEFGFVFQQGLLILELTAAENVAMSLLLLGVPRPDAEQQAAEGLAELGLAGLGERRLGQLWGGQVQRVAIARVTAGGANTVFADEPTGGLDSRTAMELLDALLGATMQTARRALVMVTHDEQVAARCSRVVRVLDGRIVDHGGGR